MALNACMIIVSVIYLHDVFTRLLALSISLPLSLARLSFSKCCGCEIFNSWPQKKNSNAEKTHIQEAHRTLNKQSMKINFAIWLPSVFLQALNQLEYDEQ